MDVGRALIRIVKCSHPHKAYGFSGTRIVAPKRDVALRAARDLLALSAVGRRQHDLWGSGQELDPVCFDHRIDDERRAGLPLAPPAMTAVYEQGFACHPIANVATRAMSCQTCVAHRRNLYTS